MCCFFGDSFLCFAAGKGFSHLWQSLYPAVVTRGRVHDCVFCCSIVNEGEIYNVDYSAQTSSERIPDKKLWELIVANRDNILSKKMHLKLSSRYILKYRLTLLGRHFFNIILKIV